MEKLRVNRNLYQCRLYLHSLATLLGTPIKLLFNANI